MTNGTIRQQKIMQKLYNSKCESLILEMCTKRGKKGNVEKVTVKLTSKEFQRLSIYVFSVHK